MKYTKETHPLLTKNEIEYWNKISAFPLFDEELETLVALVEQGPLEDGDVPSKAGRDSLLRMSCCDSLIATRVIFRCEDGYTAATPIGRDLYKAQYLSDPESSTIYEAKANRLARKIIKAEKAFS